MKQLNRLQWKMLFLSIASFIIVGQGCKTVNKNKSQYFTAEDFKKTDKIDSHCHVFSKYPAFMEQAISDNFTILSINVDAVEGPPLEKQRELAIIQQKAFPGKFLYLTSFSMKGFEKDKWTENTISYIKESLNKGAVGVKVWKNIGMVEKDHNGKFIMIDNPGFDPVFDYIVENKIPVCGHLGEPRNCWLPLSEMTVNNDKAYFEAHPEYHMYMHPEYPSYEEQIAARDHLLEKYPDLIFIGAHLGSLEWSVDEIADRLERFPNFYVDLADRICHLQVQAQTNWQKVHDFFIKYQDRIIYGTDLGDYEGDGKEPEVLKAKMHKVWIRDWTFFTSNEVMTVEEVNGNFNGLRLPKDVIEKIYAQNARKVFSRISEH